MSDERSRKAVAGDLMEHLQELRKFFDVRIALIQNLGPQS
jgi:hypothetical protein